VGERNRDSAGRPLNARPRDRLGRPVDDGQPVPRPTEAEPVGTPQETLRRAQSLLDAGLPFTAHEVLEASWKATTGPERELWRGLAQLAVGITHAERGNIVGAHALLLRGAESLEPYVGTSPHDVPVDALRRWAAAAAEDLTLVTAPPRLTGPV
jgi:uncharacterized protein